MRFWYFVKVDWILQALLAYFEEDIRSLQIGERDRGSFFTSSFYNELMYHKSASRGIWRHYCLLHYYFSCNKVVEAMERKVGWTWFDGVIM